jgi:hypothetical protein
LKRSCKRYKTESAINAKSFVEYYEHSSDSDSTSPASSVGGSSLASSGFTERTDADVITSPKVGEQQKLEQKNAKATLVRYVGERSE